MNAVVVVNIGQDRLFGYSKKTIEEYCARFNLYLEVIRNKKYDIEGEDGYNYLTLEKNQVYDLFKKYNRILRLDVDILISPHCPNLFDIVPEDKIGVVYEDVGSRRLDRVDQIKTIQKYLGYVNWDRGYFNSGVIMASRQHKDIFKIDDYMEVIKSPKLKRSKEQVILNYNVRRYKVGVQNLGYKYNHISLFSELGKNRLKSHIIHYAGKGFSNKLARIEQIKLDYDKLHGQKNIFPDLFFTFCNIPQRIRLILSGIKKIARQYFAIGSQDGF